MKGIEDIPDCRPGGHARLGRRCFIGGALSLLSMPALAAAAANSLEKPVLRFGLTPVFLSNDLEVLDELKNYLANATGHEVQLVTQRTYQEVTALLVAGNLEAAWICGYPYRKFQDELVLVATPSWRGQPLYQSYLIVGADRGASSLDDCRGDIHAFSDPDSNSGYLVTKAYLAQRHLSEDTFFRKTFFTYGHRNVIRAVAAGLANSGSVDGYVWEVMKSIEPDLVSRTKVLVKSDWYGFPPIAAPARLKGTAAFERLRSAFLGMVSDPVGRSLLGRLQLDGFVDAPPSTFDGIAANIELVRRLG
ncbi:PhnD/SsuA/transferrin family substrate-binding protein [Sinorhizobium americanum]|uniref:Phosphonate ABC transporter phosphate-binding periplasmic component n=1 Tax=Sinorhizobium americanum TaxID=194963 RepID=A0A1L3LZM5_9HYPH|nr:PhnD/SsuA/transferrin family substrate-binding protein [Sinorhizobium americanum]APG95473.1 phosphonate ABC transporter phosphate-binding periplasmic component [Sinorhizobium americanum]OAP45968.1 phosphonate ABC transporter substrate-binding protein [Sinorhizobium americanum]